MQPALAPTETKAPSAALAVPRTGISRAAAIAFSCVWLASAAVLLFWNLGFYPFWGDEADTVIFARSAWETGDLGAQYGRNLYLYRDGTLLENLKNRSTPPLSYYLAAPFWGLARDDHFWMRVPFALCGLASLALVCRWLWRAQASALMWLCVGGGVTFNVSFLLYARQCRYFALASLLTIAVGYLYTGYDGRRGRLFGIAAVLSLLAATHYLHFASLAVVMVVDYFAWQRRVRPLSAGEWTRLLVPTALVVAALVAVFNPIGKNSLNEDTTANFLADKWRLLWWSFRELNVCEMGVGIVMLCAPAVAIWRGDKLLLRLFLACVTYVVVTTLLSPQPMSRADDADIRYLAPLIIPCLYMTVRTIDLALGGRPWLVLPLVLFSLGTNILNRPDDQHAWRSTIAEFVQELRTPRRVAGRIVADWIKENVKEGESIWIEPNEFTAAQIVESPHAFYAWQLVQPKRKDDYEHLDRINYQGQLPVDFIIAFGMNNTLANVHHHAIPQLADRDIVYEDRIFLDTFFEDRTRPELHWHWFRNQPYVKNSDSAITIYRLKR